MKVIDPGHTYELTDGYALQFIKKVGGELVTEGTTNEEVLGVLIDRLKFLDKAFPCFENKKALAKLDEALWWLEERTKKRVIQGVEGLDKAHV